MSVIHDLLKKEAICFGEIEAADLGQMVERCRNKRVVLLGESTHGSDEYYRMRARITLELIEQAGFTIVACEGDWPDFEEADRFVRGVPIRYIPFQRFPVWMWRNREFFHFLDQVRSFNERASTTVRLYGFDLYGICRSIESLVCYLEYKDPSLAERAKEKLGALQLLGIEPSRYHRSVKMGGATFQAAIQEVYESIRPQLFSDELSFHILQNLRFLSRAEEAIRCLDQSGLHWNLRARQMYDALQAILDFHGPQAKAVVWAHNTHVGHTAATAMAEQGLCNIGTFCKEFYQDKAYTIGFGCYQGSVVCAAEWEGPQQIQEILPAAEGSYEHLFFETGLKRFSLHLQGEVKEHLWPARLTRGIGTIYQTPSESLSGFGPACLPQRFDEYVWFDTTSPVSLV